MLKDERDFHSSGTILLPDGTFVLIRDLRKTRPLWKFAGGKKQLVQVKRFSKKRRGETPIECFLREAYEETGLRLRKSETEYITSESKESHNKHYFLTRLSVQRNINPLSKEYEEAKLFSLNDLKWLTDFHPNYRRIFFEHMIPFINLRELPATR